MAQQLGEICWIVEVVLPDGSERIQIFDSEEEARKAEEKVEELNLFVCRWAL